MSEFHPLTQDEAHLYQRVVNAIKQTYGNLNLDELYQKAFDMVNLFRNSTRKRERADLPRCETCLWFATALRADGTPYDNNCGHCHYYGPISTSEGKYFDWPVVTPNDMCPKHEHVQS
jgi:hypothetical protein